MNERRVYLYAFDKVMRVVDTKFLEGDKITVTNMRNAAKWMTDTCQEPVIVYAVDNRRGLYKEFMDSVRATDFAKNVEFADTVQREGILIPV